MPRFTSSILRRSRRPLLGGVILLIIGGAILAYSMPKFIEYWGIIREQDEISGEWPPEIRITMEHQRKEAYEDFYRWSFFTGFGMLVVLVGLYFGVVRWSRSREINKA